MKNLLLISCCLLSLSIFSQEVKTQKDILDIPNTELVKDFNMVIGKGEIVPVSVSKATYKDIGFSFVSHKFQFLKDDFSLETHTFKDKKLVKTTNQFNYGNFMKPNGFTFNYSFDSKGNLSKRTSSSISSDLTNETFYRYKSNAIKQVKEIGSYANGEKYDKTRNFVYNKNHILFNFENGKKDIELVNNLVSKQTTFNESTNKKYIYTYQYNNNGFLVYEDRGAYKVSFVLNDKNLISKEVNNTYSQHFKYVYDKYGNWVIAYQLSTRDKKLYGSQFSFYIRQIKYSNGEVTGSINPDNDVTKTYLIKLRTELYDELIEKNVSFRKTGNSSYLFNINKQQETRNTVSCLMNKSLLVFHQPSRQLYICDNFTDKPLEKDFSAKKVKVDIKNGYWYKTETGGAIVFNKRGVYLDKIEVYAFATNKKDVIFKAKNELNKVVLINYSSAKTYTIYPVTLYQNYKPDKTSVTEEKQEVSNLIKCVNGDCKNGYGEKEFVDGTKAHGFFKDGKPCGPMHISYKKNQSVLTTCKGSYQDRIGFSYEYDGANIMTFYDKSKNISFYNDSKTKKTYKLNYKNGDLISKTELSTNSSTGCISGNCTNGIGIYKYNNSTYLGTFKNGKRDGFGYLYYSIGTSYIGEFQNNEFHGLGNFTYSNSEYDYFMGYYQNGKAHGQGVRYYAKDKYDAGIWINGVLNGKTNESSTKPVSSSAVSNTTSTLTYLSAEQINTVLACNNDLDCGANFFNALYTTESKNLSGDALTKKMTEYYHHLHALDPKLAFGVIMRVDITMINLKLLPQSVQDDIRNRAQGVTDAYNKEMKSRGY